MLGTEPAFTDACRLALGRSEATLADLHQLSCADPLTGLASMAHLRGRLTEVYRGVPAGSKAASPRERYALVVIEALPPCPTGLTDEVFGVDLRMSRIGEAVSLGLRGRRDRSAGSARGASSCWPARRDPGRRTSLLRSLTAMGDTTNGGVRIWTESLPSTSNTVANLLDELSRDQVS